MHRTSLARRTGRACARRLFAVAAVLLAPACSSLRGAHPVDVDSDRPVKVIGVAATHDAAAAYLRFFPDAFELEPGDGIRFTNWSAGEPHAIAFGRIVDEAFEAVSSLGVRPEPADVAALEDVQGLPSPLMPEDDGSLPFATPCLASDPSTIERGGCDSDELPDLDGKAALFSSGLLDEGRSHDGSARVMTSSRASTRSSTWCIQR